MSKLEVLIARFCPNGVEYKKLGDIATISRGGNFQKKDYVEYGVPCIHYGQIYTCYDMFVDKVISFIDSEKAKKQKMACTNDIIMAVTSENVEDICKCIAWLGEGEVAISGHTAIIHHYQNPKFMVYYLQSSLFYKQKIKLAHGTKVIEVTPDKLTDIVMPVPPLEVQREIVRILDKSKGLAAELIAELTTERKLRMKQYEYYRKEMFKFNNEITYVALGDICDVTAGGTPSKQRREYWDNGMIKWLSSTVCKNQKSIDEITDYITVKGFEESSAKMMKKNTTLIALIGATIGKVAFLPFEATINQNIAGVYPKDTKVLDPDYLYYACARLYSKFTALTQNSKLTIANLSFVRSLQIPVPSLKVQKRIVNVLDRFDTLCNDLSNGLSAEIEARQKQYEYYRDKLLTFEELKQ